MSLDVGNASSSAQDSQPVFGHHSQGAPPQEKKLQRNQGGFSRNKSKLFIGGLVLSLFMVAGGVAFHLSQQEGVGEIRQQASGSTSLHSLAFEDLSDHSVFLYESFNYMDASIHSLSPNSWDASSGFEDWGRLVVTVKSNEVGAEGDLGLVMLEHDYFDERPLSAFGYGWDDQHASFSVDGNHIVYSSNETPSDLSHIFIMDSSEDSTAAGEQITDDGGDFEGFTHPSLSPDNDNVVFFQNNPPFFNSFRIGMRSSDTGFVRPVTYTDWFPGTNPHNLFYSSDGEKIIFSYKPIGSDDYHIVFIEVNYFDGAQSASFITIGKHPSQMNNDTIVFVAPDQSVNYPPFYDQVFQVEMLSLIHISEPTRPY